MKCAFILAVMLAVCAGEALAAGDKGVRIEGTAKRVALVIGNDSYQKVPVLSNARKDAKAMAKALGEVGFDVILKLDADKESTLAAVRLLGDRLDGGDEAVFYFSGHGVQLGGVNYLLPVNIASENEKRVRDDALSLQRVLEDLQEQKTKFALAIIDACRDNPFKGTGKSIGGKGLAATNPATGQMIIFAAGAGQQALDNLGEKDKEPNGLFTRIFLKEMKKEGMSVRDMVNNVRDEVFAMAKTIGHDQVPALYDQTLGKFYFRPGKGGRPGEASGGVKEDGKLSEERQKLEEEKQVAEERKRLLDEERKQLDEEKRLAAERKRAEEERQREEKERLAKLESVKEEQKRVESERLRTEEAKRADEERQRLEGERRQLAEEKRKLEEERRLAEEKQKLAEEKQRLAAEREKLARLEPPREAERERPAPAGMVKIRGGRYYAGLDREKAVQAIKALGYNVGKEEFVENASYVHEVGLGDFYIDKTEVTQGEYERVMGDNPARYKGVDRPVESVSWHKADEYCKRLGKRLPTEAEWEYAAKGGGNTIYPWGNEFDGRKGNFCDKNCGEKHADKDYDDGYGTTSPVGSYAANGYGLYDMAGNVAEWVSDWYDKDYYQRAPRENPRGPESGTMKTLRGGSWGGNPDYLRTADRFGFDPSGRIYGAWFRCAQ